jgi:hypothetical protein
LCTGLRRLWILKLTMGTYPMPKCLSKILSNKNICYFVGMCENDFFSSTWEYLKHENQGKKENFLRWTKFFTVITILTLATFPQCTQMYCLLFLT